MKKKIGFGIAAILMIAGAAVFANTTSDNSCPDKPGCICSKQSVQVVKHPGAETVKKDNCPNKPGCICK